MVAHNVLKSLDEKCAVGTAYVHALKRVILPDSYQKLCNKIGGAANLSTVLENGTGPADIADYTCYYYEYSEYRQVSKETVFGQAETNTFTYKNVTPDDSGFNEWAQKTSETLENGSSRITYTNRLGDVLLTDLQEEATNPYSSHTYTYNRYDSVGHLVLQAGPSTITGYTKIGDDWNGGTPTFDPNGPVYETIYYADTSGTIGDTTAGGVADYVAYQVTRKAGSSLVPLYTDTSATLFTDSDVTVEAKYTYYRHTAGDQSVYPIAKVIDHPTNADGTGNPATTYQYAWYPNTLQAKQVRTTLPVVSPDQNGSNVAATRDDYYDANGNLTWSKDELGILTHYEYDPLTGNLSRSIQDVQTTLVTDEPTDAITTSPVTIWTTPAGAGLHQVTEYQYDIQGRQTQTLGPVVTAVVGGVLTEVRQASWTTYKDLTHETWYAQGYATKDANQEWKVLHVVGPISVTITNAGGKVAEQYEAAWDNIASDSAAQFLAGNTGYLGGYTSWTINVTVHAPGNNEGAG